MAEPSAALTFRELIVEVATKMGVARYGDDGDEEAQIPEDVHDLNECKKHVNNAVRMFLADAPPSSWRCQRPVADVILWPSVAIETVATVAWVAATVYAVGNKVTNGGESYICLVAHTAGVFAADLVSVYWRETYDCTGVFDPATDTTLVTASGDRFYPTMELKPIIVTDVGTLTIATYVSATQVRISGDHHWTGAKMFSIAANGNYTLPQTFGGQYIGDIIFAADTSVVLSIVWTDESRIRALRANSISETGDPNLAAVRQMSTRRRWELVVWPMPSTLRTVTFPYELYFDKMTGLDEMHPCGFAHDETIKRACFAAMEIDTEDMIGGLVQYYRTVALPNSYRIDGRQAPRRLGTMNRRVTVTPQNFRQFQRRPTITP